MAPARPSQTLSKRLVFLGLGAMILFIHLLPLDASTTRWPGPDWLFVLCLVWGVRRPDYAPVLSIAVLMLLGDMLLGRAPGLMAGFTVLAIVILRRHARAHHPVTFPLEWAMAAAATLGVLLAKSAVLTILLVERDPLGLVVIQLLMSIIAYPIVVGLSYFVAGLRGHAPGDLDQGGHLG